MEWCRVEYGFRPRMPGGERPRMGWRVLFGWVLGWVLAACVLSVPLAGRAAEMALYGQALVSLDGLNTRDYPGPDEDEPLAVNGNRSWLGFRGREGVREHLDLLWRAEVYLDLDEGGWSSGREAYAGLRHRLGTLRVGRQATPYRRAGDRLDGFADTRADIHAVMGNLNGEPVFGNRLPHLVSYETPRLKGVQLLLAATPAYGPDRRASSAALILDRGPLYLALAYERLQRYESNLAVFAAADHRNAAARKLVLGWDFGQGTRLDLFLEEATNGARLSGRTVGRRAYHLALDQVLGNVTWRLAGAYLEALDGLPDSGAVFGALGFDHALSPRLAWYARYVAVRNEKGAAYGLVADADDPAPLLPAAGEDLRLLSLGLRFRFERGI